MPFGTIKTFNVLGIYTDVDNEKGNFNIFKITCKFPIAFLPNGNHFSAFGSASILAEATAFLMAKGTDTERHIGGSPMAEKYVSSTMYV